MGDFRLVNSKMNTNFGDSGFNLAVAAIQSNDITTMRKGLEQLKNIETRDENGNTLLTLAVHAERYGIAKILLDARADVNAMGRHRRTPVDIAAEFRNSRILSLLLKRGGDPNLRPIGDYYDDVPPLHLAAEANSPKCIELLLDYGAEINARDEAWQRTALHVSLDTDPALRAAECLILRGADIHAHDKMGATPLQEAIACNATRIVALLRQRGAF